MRCDKCGHHNPSDKFYCKNCGSPLSTNSYDKSAVRKYKDTAKRAERKQTFNKKEKFIIAICIAAMALLILSSVVPSDLEMPQITDNQNSTDNQTQTQIEDKNTTKINTKIYTKSTTLNSEGKIVLNAYVSDENDIAVNGGITSVYINDIKYSGTVVNGNVNIVLPNETQNTQVTLIYEGNDEYNPSQTTAYIEIPKIDTKIDIQNNNDTIIATLTTIDGQAVPNATITVSGNNTEITQTTDAEGKINVTPQENTTQITFRFDGNSKYNKAENTIQLMADKTDTQLSTQYDEIEKELSIKLIDARGNPINGQNILIYDNDNIIKESTNMDGIASVNINQGEHNLLIKYEGNDNFNPSNTTLKLNISKDINDTNTTNSTTNNTNTSNNTKTSTVIDTEINDEHTVVTATLTDNNGKPLTNEHITVTLSNGTELSKKTDETGVITIYLDSSSNISEMELSFKGTDDYYSTTKIFEIGSKNSTSHH